MPAARWRSQLSRRTTVLRRKTEAFRRCSTLLRCSDQAQSARHGALVRRTFGNPPTPKRQPPQWRLFACHASAGRALEITARTSHRGVAHEERGLPPVQCPFMMRRPITTSATRRERAAASRVSPHPKRTSAQWRLFACHVNAGRALEVTALSSHHGLAPEKEKYSAGAILFSNARTNLNQHGTARACGKLARFAISKVVVLFACHVKAGCASEITARTSHHGLAPKREASHRCSTLP